MTNDVSKRDWQRALKRDERCLVERLEHIRILEAGGTVQHLTLERARLGAESLRRCIANKKILIASMAGAD